MATLRKMRGRIQNIQNTQKVTKSMKMVAVSKLRKAQAGMRAARLFTAKSEEILSGLRNDGEDGSRSNPYAGDGREIRRVCYVLFVGNRGLCGAYNSGILRYLVDLAAEEERAYTVVVCGRWGKDAICSIGLPVERMFPEIGDIPTGEQATELAEYLKRRYLGGETDTVVLVYQRFADAMNQIPARAVLLPVDLTAARAAREGGTQDARYLFEPDRAAVLDQVIRLRIDSAVYSVLLEARAGEHASRMRAMTSASENTEELIAELKLKLNRARQGAITTEISEIVGGASAQKIKQEEETQALE